MLDFYKIHNSCIKKKAAMEWNIGINIIIRNSCKEKSFNGMITFIIDFDIFIRNSCKEKEVAMERNIALED